MVSDTIYLSDVYGELKNMMKIKITKHVPEEKMSLDSGIGDLSSQTIWNFELSTECKEFT